MDLAALTYETAKALEGTEFQVELPDGTAVPMKLEEVLPYETRQRRRARGKTPRRDPFSVYFLGPVSPILPQAMYTFRGETETIERLFIVPIGQDGDATEYEAVFTVTPGVTFPRQTTPSGGRRRWYRRGGSRGDRRAVARD